MFSRNVRFIGEPANGFLQRAHLAVTESLGNKAEVEIEEWAGELPHY